jgi:RNA polymerase sigma factor (sigma-70 family)
VTAPPTVVLADDVALIRQSRVEPEHFALLFDKYHPEIYRFVGNRLGVAFADDLAAETFLVAFEKRARFDSEGAGAHVRAWLYGIATNLIRRHHRDEERRYRALARAAQDQLPDSHDDQVAAKVSAQSMRGVLAAALASLSPPDRDVILLVALGELDHREVAAALGIPYGTVGSRLNRVRRKVSKQLGGLNPSREGSGKNSGG